MRPTYDFTRGERGKYAQRYQEAVLPARTATRLVLSNRIQTILEDFAAKVSDDPDHLAGFLSECWYDWETGRG